jgi:3',5'-cyclic AMP phosphodiesterase CpdA
MTEPLYVLHLTDVHLPPEPGALVQSIDPALALTHVLDHALALPVPLAACVISGDLTRDGEPEAYRRLVTLLEPLAERRVPVVLSLGNHDNRPSYRQALPGMPLAFVDADGPCCATYRIGDLRFLALDSHVPGAVEGALGEEQLAWLDRELQQPAPGGDVLVVHHPVTPPGVPWLDDTLLTDAPALAAVLRGRPLLGILSGHVHVASATPWAGTVATTAPAVAFQFTPFPTANGKVVRGHGYSLCTVRDGALTVNPVWLTTTRLLPQEYQS